MGAILFEEGDNLTIIRRRAKIIDEGGQQITVYEDEIVSTIRCPEKFLCIGGQVEPSYEASDKAESGDKRYLVIKLEMKRA